jgi:hypothetical protein
MTAAVIRFPPRCARAVWLVRDREENGFLVLHGAHGWLHGDRRSALVDAVWVANNTGLRRIVINGGRA